MNNIKKDLEEIKNMSYEKVLNKVKELDNEYINKKQKDRELLNNSFTKEKRCFYTVMEGDKFIHSNICCGMTSNITNSVKFELLDDVKEFMEDLNKEKNFKVVKVICQIQKI